MCTTSSAGSGGGAEAADEVLGWLSTGVKKGDGWQKSDHNALSATFLI